MSPPFYDRLACYRDASLRAALVVALCTAPACVENPVVAAEYEHYLSPGEWIVIDHVENRDRPRGCPQGPRKAHSPSVSL